MSQLSVEGRAPAALCLAAAVTILLASCGGSGGPVGPGQTPGTTASPTSGVPTRAEFELTFVADGSCTSLPEEARTRRYTATLPEGSSLARLGGAVFADGGPYGSWNGVHVKILGESVDVWFQDPPIWESLSDGRYLVIYGDAHGQLPSESATIPFWARFEYCRQREPASYPKCAVPVTRCESREHHLVVDRK